MSARQPGAAKHSQAMFFQQRAGDKVRNPVLQRALQKARPLFVGKRAKGALPDGARVAGPFRAFKPGDALPVADQVLSIYAGVNGFLDDVPVDKVQQFEADLLHHIQQNHPDLKKEVTPNGKIDDKVGGRLKEIISTFKQKMGYGAK